MFWGRPQDILEMPFAADAVEKRWLSLRNMFSRENRKQKSIPSGSGSDGRKEWELYRQMLFLDQHVSHRASRKLLTPIGNKSLPAIVPSTANDHLYGKGNKENTYDRPGSSLSCYSDSDSSLSETKPTLSLNNTIKAIPELYAFAKRRKHNNQVLEKKIVEAADAIKIVASAIMEKESKSGYVMLIEEKLKRVNEKHKIDCFIEILQILRKYEGKL